jgi:hypothetical protein
LIQQTNSHPHPPARYAAAEVDERGSEGKIKATRGWYMNNRDVVKQQSDFILYTGNDGKVNIDVFVQDENVWLTQKAMGLLFGVESHTITYHLKEIFKSGELDEKATTRKNRVVQNEGERQVTRELDFYNLDAIIAFGFRVNSVISILETTASDGKINIDVPYTNENTHKDHELSTTEEFSVVQISN